MLDHETGGKGLSWSNFYVDLDKTGKKYQGQWNEQRTIEGLGTIVFKDGSKYQGQTKNGMFNGKGRMNHLNGDIYQGEFVDGKAHGDGVYIDQSGTKYEGQWQNNMYHGEGKEIFNFGSVGYQGDFVEA